MVLRREIARFNFTSSYLVFELYAAHGCLHTAFLCSLNRFKSTTRRADEYCPLLFFARSTVAAYKTAVRLFNQSEQIPSRDCFKAGAAALFLKFDF